MANEMREKHLVTDNPQNMTESMLNFAYAKNERVYLRYANGTEDIDLCEYVSQLTKGDCKLSADDVMQGSCIEGCDCEKAVIYALAVQAAELRERLKHYENLEERGLLQTLPCMVGDKIWYITTSYMTKIPKVQKGYVEKIIITKNGIDLIADNYVSKLTYGKRSFLTKAEAEQKLKEMRGDTNA